MCSYQRKSNSLERKLFFHPLLLIVSLIVIISSRVIKVKESCYTTEAQSAFTTCSCGNKESTVVIIQVVVVIGCC